MILKLFRNPQQNYDYKNIRTNLHTHTRDKQIHTHIYTHLPTPTHTFTHLHTPTETHLHSYTHTFTHLHTHLQTSTTLIIIIRGKFVRHVRSQRW